MDIGRLWMLNKLKSLKKHQGFMKYFKNTSNANGTMVTLTNLSKLYIFIGWKYIDLDGGIKKMYVWYCASVDSASFMESNK